MTVQVDFRLNPQFAATPENTYSQMMQRLAADSPDCARLLRESTCRSTPAAISTGS